MIKLFHGDCLDVLPTLEANSVDSIVTDPPYGLTADAGNWREKSGEDFNARPDLATPRGNTARKRGGFMGKEWDSAIPGVPFWEAALRVAKPGAHLLAFGGTRTFHRLACAIEDAGWEIRDTVMWVYGCLSDDTEILTSNGWERYHTLVAGSPALCYNLGDDTFRWEPIQEVVTYDYSGTAYRIQSDCTDQLVSRNHRCLVERGGRTVFEYAEALQCQESVPVLEDMHGLLAALPVLHKGTSGAKSDLRAGVQREAHQPTEAREASRATSPARLGALLRLWQRVVAAREGTCWSRPAGVQSQLQRRSAKQGVDQAFTQRARGLDSRERGFLPREDERGQQSRVERWRHLLQDTWQLCRRKVRALSTGVRFYGPQGRLCYGASLASGAGDWPSSVAIRGSASHRPRSDEQRLGQSATVREQQTPQVVRASRFATPSLATVTPVHYNGIVWCVRVPSGAFVARRNGKVFITGNSGFPKSLDISKAIDKAAGAEREVVGRYRTSMSGPSHQPNGGGPFSDDNYQWKPYAEITNPATSAAAEWDGWGTALKPAWEPVIVARKPLEGTVAANVLRWGTGGINIDGCRVGTEQREWHGMSQSTKGRGVFRDDGWDAKEITRAASGRWPANLVHDGSDEVVALFPVTKSGKRLQIGGSPRKTVEDGSWAYGGTADRSYAVMNYGDSGSAARFFQACPWDEDDRRLYARCALCGLPDNARHGIMTAEDMPCSSNASSAEKTLHQETTITNSGFVVTPVQQSGQHSSEDRPEQSTRNAQSAGSCFGPSPATTGDIALTSADSKQLESLVRNVKCAGNLCDLCATAIAQSIVLMKRGQSPASLHGLASISEHKKQILTQCLVSFVALLGNTDTTPTMDNLNLFFGYVRDAIANYTPTHEKRQVETQPPTRLQYVSKASKRDRDEGLEGGVTLELEVCLCGANTERGISLEKAISAYVMGLGTHEWNTTSYGSERSVLFHRVILSTTSMETSKTTESKTWSVLTSLPTSGFIAGVIRTIQECGSSLAASADSISQLLNTMSEKAVSARGAKTVVSETPLRISASARPMANGHCTVKPTALMRYLVRLVTPPGGVVLDPFMGSGSTGKAARLEGRDFIGIEMDADYHAIAEARIAWAEAQVAEAEPVQLSLGVE